MICRSALRPVLAVGALALAAASLLPLAASAAAPVPAAPDTWTRLSAAPETSGGASRVLKPARSQTWQLDAGAYSAALRAAGSPAVGAAPTVVSLPGPDGGLVRFAVQPSTVMAPGLAAAHPEIRTWAGRGLDDPTATVHLDLGSLGLHASVRSPAGAWYVDPYYTRDRGTYLSYWGRDLANAHGTFVETDDAGLEQAQAALGDAAPDLAAVPASTGPRTGDQLRSYRLALVSDPSYAEFFGSENVTAAKVALINRVDQIYEDDLAIRLELIGATDRLNLDTPALASGPNGPCGPQACFTAESLESCTIPALLRNENVLARIVGSSAYDVGHLALGNSGGGIAGLGVVGASGKAIGCTGVPDPVGDFYAVDYVAHELGHQFGGNHTFNGVKRSCSGINRNAATSVEPGSGSSIMAYAGICLRDDLQPHSDPYFSERSQSEIQAYVGSALAPLNEVQAVDLRAFDGADSFALSFRGQQTSRITRGTASYTADGIAAALKRILPRGAELIVTGQRIAPQPDDLGFLVRFRGSLDGLDLPALQVVAARGTAGSTVELRQGGPTDNAGAVTRTGNTPPVVTAPARYVLPLRTPFALTGSATDADGDVLTYLWEQNDAGGQEGTFLLDADKRNGPLFRQFGQRLDADAYQAGTYGSPGENTAGTSPRRVFPDMAQVLAGNTNAKTGDCEGFRGVYEDPAPLRLVDCYSEFLPTRAYVGLGGQAALHFRLTARDNRFGGGGVASDDTTVVLAQQAGPFLVTSQPGGQTVAGGSSQPVRWDVARTDVAPVGTSQVRITMSRDGGRTWPVVLAEATANDGQQQVTIPAGATTTARIRVEAVGNVFFAVNAGEFAVSG